MLHNIDRFSCHTSVVAIAVNVTVVLYIIMIIGLYVLVSLMHFTCPELVTHIKVFLVFFYY